jgi:hypothetical protein
MATAIIPSGTGTQTQEITINNLVKKWNAMTPNQQAKNYVNFKNKLNNKLTQEQKNKVIKYINNKLTQEQKNKVNSKSFTGEGRRLTNVNRTILKEQLLNTYLTFTYEMGPGMEKKIFWRYVLLLLYSYNQIYGGLLTKNNMNVFVEQYYPKTNTMNGVVSEDQQKKWANVFMKLLNKMDSTEGLQIFIRLQKNISSNINNYGFQRTM